MSRTLIIPAAGRGKRLESDLPKVLFPIDGRAMLDYLFDRYLSLVDRIVLVVHPSFESEVRDHCAARSFDAQFVLQPDPTGMLPAILLPLDEIEKQPPDQVWITWCDQVAVRSGTVRRMARLAERDDRPKLTFPTVWKTEPYIHFTRDAAGQIDGVLQRREGDSMPSRGEGDSGLFCLAGQAYLEELPRFAGESRPGTGTGEANFLPFIPWLAQRAPVVTFPVEHESESVGINSRADVERVREYLRELD